MRAIQHASPGASTRARASANADDRAVPRPCVPAPAGDFLDAWEGGLELWLSGGHVYSHHPSGGPSSHVCRLAAPNRLHKQNRRLARRVAPGNPTDNRHR